jgi:hypothetical protein
MSGSGHPAGSAADRAMRARTNIGQNNGGQPTAKARVGAAQSVTSQPGRRPVQAHAGPNLPQVSAVHAQPKERKSAGSAAGAGQKRMANHQPAHTGQQAAAHRRQPADHGNGGRTSFNPSPRTSHRNGPSEQPQVRAHRRPVSEGFPGGHAAPRSQGGQARIPQAHPGIRERRAPIERAGPPAGAAPRGNPGHPRGGGGPGKGEEKKKHGG